MPARADSSDMDVGGYGKRRADGHALMGLAPIPEEHLKNGPEMPSKRLLDAFPYEEKPSWAAKLIDKRQVMPWNSQQFVAQLAVQGVLTTAIVDTGAVKSVIDLSMAE